LDAQFEEKLLNSLVEEKESMDTSPDASMKGLLSKLGSPNDSFVPNPSIGMFLYFILQFFRIFDFFL
jgi:hypothetical protein